MPVDKLTIEQFAQRVKLKYPQYKDVNDSVLVEKMVSKYPEYKEKVNYENAQQPKQLAATQGQQFKPMSDWLNIPQAPQPMVQENTVNDHNTKTAESANRIKSHLADIDKSVHNLIYEKKKDLTGRIKSEELAINPSEQGPVNFQAKQLEQKGRQDAYVSPVEVQSFKEGMNQNTVMLRQALNQKAKDLRQVDEAAEKQFKGDIYQLDRQATPEKETKISKNIEKINKGEYDYDIVNGRLTKPEGFFPSIVTGFKTKNKLFEDYELFSKTENKADIIRQLNKRTKEQDADDPVIVPTGVGELGAMLGGMPIKPIVGGIAASALTTPAGGAVAAAAISAHEMYKLGYASALTTNYAALKRQFPDKSDEEIYEKAQFLAEAQANIDAATGATMGLIGARVAIKPTTSLLLQKSVTSALKQIGETVAIEGLGGGAVGATGQYVKNLISQKAGIPIDETEGMAQQLFGGAVMTLGIALGAKAGKLLKPSTYGKLLHGLSKMPEEAINEQLNKAQEIGAITPEEAQRVQSDITDQKKIDASVPDNVPESERVKIHSKIKERDALQAKLETTDKAFHPELKEKIKALDEEIVNISKGNDRGELQQLVDKAAKDKELIGVGAEELKHHDEKTLKVFFKDIAEQAHDPATEQLTIETFGQSIVNKAKELYPKEEPKQPSISVIQPGEIKQPETIIIKPKANAATEPVIEGSTIADEATGNMGEAPAGTAEPIAEQPIPESAPNDPKGPKVSEPEMQGITHAEMDRVSRELGLPEYTKDPETQNGWIKEAKDRMAKDPNSINKLVNKLRNGEMPDPVETKMMQMHFAALKDRYNKNPTPELLNEINRTKDLYNISGRQEGKSFAARKGLMPVDESSLADYHLRDVDYNKGAPLTEEQLAQSTKEFQEISAVKTALDEKVMKLEAENAKLKAQKEVEKIAKTAKKDGKRDYKAEREQLLTDMKKKWDESKGQLSATIIPYADRLVKIAPDAAKLVKLLVEEGIDKLPELVKAAHDHLKNFIPEITEKDVHDLIAGEYSKKQTRTQLAATLYDLKKEAQSMNELDQLLNGEVPQNQKKQIKRNQRIEELRKQIKDLKDEIGLNERTDSEKLASLKGRYKTKIKGLEDKISKGDYKPDEKPVPIELDKEGQKLRDRYLELKEERELRLLEQEYANRGKGEKVIGAISKALKTGRTFQSSFDVSYPYRQTLPGLSRELFAIPFKKRNGEWRFTKFEQQKQLAGQFGKMYQSFGSEKVFRRVMDDIHNDPNYKKWKKAGLDFADPISNLDKAKEEMFQGSYAEDIPGVKIGVKASHRAATVIANKMKWDIANQLAEKFQDRGRTFENSPELYEATAKYANQLVGRGILGKKLENAAPVIAHFVYSLRLYASRLQLLTNMVNPRFYAKVPKEIRIEYFKDMAKFVALGGTIMSLAAASGLKVGLNPLSSDFGSIVAGDTRYDIWGGFKQYVVLFSKLLAGKTVDSHGNNKDLRELFSEEDSKWGEKSRGDVLLRFLRTKASPELGSVINITTGKDFANKNVTVKSAAWDYFAPLIYRDVEQSLKDGKVSEAMLIFLLAAHGVGVQNYGSDKKDSTGSSNGSVRKKGKPTKQSKPSKNTK